MTAPPQMAPESISVTRWSPADSAPEPRALERARELRREEDAEDRLVAGQLLVDGREVRRRGLRAARRLRRLPQAPVEVLRGDVDVLA